ncbi:MAG: hypothetical protein ACRD0A_06100 [Acidimicrobiales bacterium]
MSILIGFLAVVVVSLLCALIAWGVLKMPSSRASPSTFDRGGRLRTI